MCLRPPRPRAIRANALPEREIEREPTYPASEDVLGIPPGILRSQEAFWRDLPHLLSQRKLRGRWVCYHGDERVGIGTYDELIRRCIRRGIPDDAFYLWPDPSSSPGARGRRAARTPPSRSRPHRIVKILDRFPTPPMPRSSQRLEQRASETVPDRCSRQRQSGGPAVMRPTHAALPTPSWTRGTTTTSPSAGGTPAWAGLQPEAVRIIGTMRDRQKRLPLPAASVWLTGIGQGHGP